jgi:hypothetical protein
MAPAAASASPPVLTKEYIYAGGRLVAIEEQGITTTGPTSLVASAQANGQVSLSWSVPASGNPVDHYEVERTESLTGASPYQFNCASTSCPDPAAIVGKVYFYRVRAVFSGGAQSAYSNQDLALTFIFADDPLNANATRTFIKARHFTELRDAINALRVAISLPTFGWTLINPGSETVPHSSGRIYASHYNDLRANLFEALNKLGLPGPQTPLASGGNTVTVTFKPVQELRDLIR